MAIISLFSVLYALAFALCYYAVICEPEQKSLKKKESLHMAVIGLGVWFIIQLVMAQAIPGHKQDISCFKAWAAFAESHPVWEYYTTDIYVDYPPVYLYVLYCVGKMAQLFGVTWDSPTYLVFIKFIPIVFDALTAVFIYRFGRERIGETKALALAFLSTINPMNVLNSTIWGQVDSVTTFVSVIMFLALYEKRYVLSCGLFALLFLTKPQMIIFAPVLGFVFLFDIISVWKNSEERNKILKQAGLSVVAAVVVVLIVPLLITGGNYSLLIQNYLKALGLYPYATLNAPNLFGMFGGNWVKNDEVFFLFTYKGWGFIFIVALSLFTGYIAYRRRDRNKVFELGALMVLGIYMLAHTMHERYIYPALLLLLFVYMLSGDRKTLLFYGGFSITSFIVCTWVLQYNQIDEFIYGDNVGFRLLSLVNVVLFGLWVYHTFFNKNKTVLVPSANGKTSQKSAPAQKKSEKSSSPAPEKEQSPVPEKVQNNQKKQTAKSKSGHNAGGAYTLYKEPAPSVRFVRLDYLLMLGLMLFYAVFGFYNLGPRAVPETGWYHEAAQEGAILDLGEIRSVSQIYVFAGWMDRRSSDQNVARDIRVQTSSDRENWTDMEPLKLTSVFKWHTLRFDPVDCRYICLMGDDGRFYMNEVAVYGETEADYYPIQSVSSHHETAQLLIDEQDKIVYDYSWYDGTYFDEIYHPRTAYEHIHHLYPYENTHPPLGKVIISAGIRLFGMTPFGWRFFGALCGVLMVPLAYALGKTMLKKTSYAFATAAIFSFDFMHLSQTRLATIDSYTAFFVMGMYLFMFLYIEKSFYYGGVKKTLLPLFLSGLCFGLGAATKWQGIYAGVGLAFLFFFNLWRRWKEYNWATSHRKAPGAEAVINGFKPMALQTVIAGAVFFVAVPFVIYFLSYIPAMMTDQTGLSFFFSNQSSMLNYHGGLQATHSYSSSWWQWPFDYKPLYLYNPNRDFVPQGTSMGITTFGNPLVWWLTIPAVIWAVHALIKKKRNIDIPILTMVVGFLSMYLPWVLVSRTAFIYHFFPCVIFVVLMVVRFAADTIEKRPVCKKVLWVYVAAVFILFVAFYPVLTGMAVPTSYVDLLRWVPGWVLG